MRSRFIPYLPIRISIICSVHQAQGFSSYKRKFHAEHENVICCCCTAAITSQVLITQILLRGMKGERLKFPTNINEFQGVDGGLNVV